jgi:integrase
MDKEHGMNGGMSPLTHQQVKDIAASFSGTEARRNKALFVLGVRTGYRVSELLSLRVANVMHGDRIAERVTVPRRSMKGKGEGRMVALDDEARTALKTWLDELRAMTGSRFLESPLFPSRKRPCEPIDRKQAWKVLHEASEANGLDLGYGTHCLRKTFANRAYEKLGHDLVKTQRVMGHKNVNSTVSYLRFRDEDIWAELLA